MFSTKRLVASSENSAGLARTMPRTSSATTGQNYFTQTDGTATADWFEVISENFMIRGGRPLHVLERARRLAPIVLHGVSIEIPDGSFTVLVGPSGCGKSTLLRMIAGLEDISAGEISIGGRIVNRIEPKDRDIAMVFQNYALYPHMTNYENMAYGLKIAKVPKDEIKARGLPSPDLGDALALTFAYPVKKHDRLLGHIRASDARNEVLEYQPFK